MTVASPRPDISIVLPAYNSEAFIEETVRSVVGFFEARSIDVEVIVADDGSTDNTAQAATIFSSRVKVVSLPSNQGKGAALKAGFLAANGKAMAFTDADLPYGVEPLLRAYQYIRHRGFHAVVGDRTLPGSKYGHAGIVRQILSSTASFLFRTLVTGGFFDTQCGLKAFRGDVAHALFSMSTVRGFAIDVELIYLLLKYRLDIKRLPVQLERNASSSVRVFRDSARATKDILKLRLNWGRGLYRSTSLTACLEADLKTDIALFESLGT